MMNNPMRRALGNPNNEIRRIKNESRRNKINYNRIMNNQSRKFQNIGANMPELEPVNNIREPSNSELEDEYMRGGGLTQAQIDFEAENI